MMPGPVNGRAPDVAAGSRPIALLSGLFVGTLTLLLTLGWFWVYGWLLPLILAGVTHPFRATRAFGIGAFAASCGAAVAVGVELVLMEIALL